MQKLLFLFLCSVFLFVQACGKSAATQANVSPVNTGTNSHPGDDAPRITLADAKKEFDAGTAVFVDVRSPEAYKQEHIKGSINITSATLDANYKSLPSDKKIVAYCS